MSNPKENSSLSPSLNESPGAVPNLATVNGLRAGLSFMEGWIKLHRKIRENWIWKDPVKFQWWVDILLEVNHSPAKVPVGFDIIECGKGQSIRSLQGWAVRWGTSKDTARNFLKMLQKDNMIVCENLTKTTRITVCNYESYQTELHVKQTGGKRKANAKQTQSDPNKNDKNNKEVLGWQNDEVIYQTILTKYPKLLQMKVPLSYDQHKALIAKWGAGKIVNIYSEMQNYSKLLNNNDEAAKTANNWLRRNEERLKK